MRFISLFFLALIFSTVFVEAIPGDVAKMSKAAAVRSCNRKLLLMVLATCGDSCDPDGGEKLSEIGCSRQVDEEEIKSICCPIRL